MARSPFFQTPELYPNFPHTSTLVLLKSLTRNQTSCWEMSLMLLALSMELFCWLVTVSCPCLGLRGFGYQNPLISNRYNFMKCATSLHGSRNGVRKGTARPVSADSIPRAGLWVTPSSPCSPGAGKITPNPRVRCWDPLRVSPLKWVMYEALAVSSTFPETLINFN